MNMSAMQAKQNEDAKDRYMKFFMIDYLEFNLRRVLVENTTFCAQRCKLFEDIGSSANILEAS